MQLQQSSGLVQIFRRHDLTLCVYIRCSSPRAVRWRIELECGPTSKPLFMTSTNMHRALDSMLTKKLNKFLVLSQDELECLARMQSRPLLVKRGQHLIREGEAGVSIVWAGAPPPVRERLVGWPEADMLTS